MGAGRADLDSWFSHSLNKVPLLLGLVCKSTLICLPHGPSLTLLYERTARRARTSLPRYFISSRS